MSLYGQWQSMVDGLTEEQMPTFTEEYYDKEEAIYASILKDHTTVVEGKFSELAKQYEMDEVIFAGFMDGINSSLKKPYTIEKLKASSDIKLEIDFEKLYYQMLEAKAPWLYELEEWDEVLPEAQRKEIAKNRRIEQQAVSEKIDRNSPCPCGSGKKYKKCCGSIANS